MTISQWLDELECRFIDDAARRRIVAEGRRLEDIHEIKKHIAQELEGKPSVPELFKEAEKLFLDSLMGRGLPLSSSILVKVGQPRKVNLLNRWEAACLWLGLFRQQTFGLAGLWQMYLDIKDPTIRQYLNVKDPVIPLLPDIIRNIFDPQGRDGENQDYIDKTLQGARQEVPKLTDKDTTKIIAWIVETKLPPRPRRRCLSSTELANDLQQRRSKAANVVNQDLKRGGNTLMDEFVRCAYREIDNY